MSGEYGVRSAEYKSRVAVLWDESFLWGLMACKALKSAGLPFELVRAEDVRRGCLDRYAALLVPGGWASNKMKALGEDGAGAIRRFVENGGSYAGFCGGAGLATLDGLGLVPVKRRSTKERVPSFSGRVRLMTIDHPLWKGLGDPVFHAWWPSQFVTDGSVRVLASYAGALPDSFSSDVNVGDTSEAGKWQELEDLYGINLDPKRLIDEPAVLEGQFGKGRVLLSLVHFDTPGDGNGALVLKNLWEYLMPDGECGMPNEEKQLRISPCTRASTRYRRAQADCTLHSREHSSSPGTGGLRNETKQDDGVMSALEGAVNGLIDLGLRNFLWFWRNDLLLQWRRGVRGLEYCTLYILVREISGLLQRRAGCADIPGLDARLNRVRALLLPFVEKASRLLVLERIALQNGHITYEQCDDPAVQALRDELFSRSKSHGGLFKELLDEIDRVLYTVMADPVKDAGAAVRPARG